VTLIPFDHYLADADCPELVDAFSGQERELFNPYLPADELEDYYSEEDGYSYTE